MKKTIKILIILNIFTIVFFCWIFAIKYETENKLIKLHEKRHNLVEEYMKKNNLPTIEDTLILFYHTQKEQDKRKQLGRIYESIEKRIYQKEKKEIDKYEYKQNLLISFLDILFYLFCFLSICIMLYYILKPIDFKNNLNQIIPIFISISFLLLAIFETEVIEADAFYSLLKIIVSATLFYISFMIRNSKSILFWLSISLGILFNPVVQIHLNDSDLWQKIDILTIIYFIVYILNKLKVKK